MGVSGRTSKLSGIIAILCIFIYVVAISFGVIQIMENIGERRNMAEKEFYDLSDITSSSAVFLGFMSEAYRESIIDFINGSSTLLGVIITGSDGEYTFERETGSGIIWQGNSPRFKTGPGFSKEPFLLYLRIDGQRNVTIQANYSPIDNNLVLMVLRNTLLAVLAALAVALFTLLVELLRRNNTKNAEKETVRSPVYNIKEDHFVPKTPDAAPRGLFTRRGNIGWESYTHDRLDSEIQRCASFEQDLVFIVMEIRRVENLSDGIYRQFADEAVSFFAMRDLVFEKGENGFSIIIPNMDLEQGINKSENFLSRFISILPESLKGQAETAELCMGLSSRSGRLIDADRLILEAERALEKALSDPTSNIVAFKSDPEKYREYIKGL